ncbi:MAG: SRPBCC family protein [Solirubrobacterales bacterium]
MSEARQQAYIEAPVEVVWELLADVDRHPEWWPRVIAVQCEGLEPGCTYRQVTQTPVGKDNMKLQVDSMEDCRNLLIRCVNTGTFVHWTLTEAQQGTFVDARFGMEPLSLKYRAFDLALGRRFFRNWLEESLDAMRRVASRRAAGSPTDG